MHVHDTCTVHNIDQSEIYTLLRLLRIVRQFNTLVLNTKFSSGMNKYTLFINSQLKYIQFPYNEQCAHNLMIN